MYVLLKGVAEAVEHCTQTQVKFTVVGHLRLRDGRFCQGLFNLPLNFVVQYKAATGPLRFAAKRRATSR
jgi:hypothetical protein